MKFIVFAFSFFNIISKKPKPNYPWYIKKLNINSAWKKTKGEDVVIAVLDSGIHKDLYKDIRSKIIKPYNFVDDNHDVTDHDGHGTSIASIIAYNDSSNDFYGIANECKIMPLVVMGFGGRVEPLDVSKAIIYATNNGANIINMSFGFKLFNEEIENAISYAYEKGVIMISAVGDDASNTVLYPASSDKVIGVQSQSKYGKRFADASWGEGVNVMIPGENIRFVDYTDGLTIKQSSGSSYATAIMSGIVALKLKLDKEDFNYISLENYLKNTSTIFFDVLKFIKEEK